MQTLSYDSGVARSPLLFETLAANLERTAASHPDHEALVDVVADIRWTYAQLLEQVDALARALLALGVQRHDRIAIWSPNCASWVQTEFAVAKVGAILVTINPAYQATEVRHVLEKVGVSVLLAAPGFRSSDYVRIIEDVRPFLPSLREVAFIGTASWDALLQRADAVDGAQLAERSSVVDPDDPVTIQFTSGTTGDPKGATLSHHSILNNGFLLGERIGYGPADRLCVPVPLFHCFGMVASVLAATTHGATIVLPAPAFDPGAVLTAVERERCTSLVGVPAMFIAELEHPEFARFDVSSLRTGMMGGAPCPPEILKRVASDLHMPEVAIGYGMTETSPCSVQTFPEDDFERRVSTVGRVLPHTEVKIVDPATGRTVARGTPGELCARGYLVMQGYWDSPQGTAGAIDPAGWMHTGDLATMDDDGYVAIVGRIKDMIIRGGENVYAREVEDFLYTHPAVAEVYVIGVPHARLGEQVMAWVRAREGCSVDADELRAFCRAGLAHFKVPEHIHFAASFPMTASGKVQKFKLRERAIELLGLGDGAR